MWCLEVWCHFHSWCLYVTFLSSPLKHSSQCSEIQFCCCSMWICFIPLFWEFQWPISMATRVLWFWNVSWFHFSFLSFLPFFSVFSFSSLFWCWVSWTGTMIVSFLSLISSFWEIFLTLSSNLSWSFHFQYHTSKYSFNSDWILKNYGSTLFHAYNIFPYLSEENNEFFWSFIFHE